MRTLRYVCLFAGALCLLVKLIFGQGNVSWHDPSPHRSLLEVTRRLPGRINPAWTTFASANDLASAMRRAAAAPRRAREAQRSARRQLARLVRSLHDGGAGRNRAADVSDCAPVSNRNCGF